MSRLLRADQVSSTQNTTTSWTVHQRAEAQTGDVVTATFAYSASVSLIGAPDGTWTALPVAVQNSAVYLATFYKTLTAGGAANYTFTGISGRAYVGHCLVVAGSAPIATTTGGTSVTASRAAATPASPGSLVLAVVTTVRNLRNIPIATGTPWRRRCATLSGYDTLANANYLGAYEIDNAPASPAPSLTLALPVSTDWVAQTLVFTPNSQPAAVELFDHWSPRSGVWTAIPESIPVSGAWV